MPKTKAEPDLSGFITTSDVAKRYDVSQVDVQKAIKRGQIRAQKVGYFYLIWEPGLPRDWPAE